MEEIKNLLVFGMTGAGKSYFLNILLGFNPEEDEDYPFEIANECLSCTKLPHTNTGFLYKVKTNPQICAMDLPGLYDTADNTDQMPYSIKILQDLENIITKSFNKKINKILFCIDINRSWDIQLQNTLKILYKFINNKSAIAVIITKCNSISKVSKQKKKKSWKEVLNKQGFQQIFFFGTSAEIDEDFKTCLVQSVKGELTFWKDLSVGDQLEIGKYFNYIVPNQGCFSLEMLISLNDGQITRCVNRPSKPLMTDEAQENQFLGFVHFDQHSLMQFIQFVTFDSQVLECTENHLIYCSTIKDGKEYNSYIKAGDIQVGDHLLIIKLQSNGNIIKIPSQIKNKQDIIKKGYWCPLTSKGNLVVNNFLVSSYTSNGICRNQKISHLCMFPLICYRKAFGYQNEFENGKFLSSYGLTSLRNKILFGK